MGGGGRRDSAGQCLVMLVMVGSRKLFLEVMKLLGAAGHLVGAAQLENAA